jgi:hypothetical protein
MRQVHVAREYNKWWMDRNRQWQMVVGGLIVLKTCTYFCICDALMNPMKEISVEYILVCSTSPFPAPTAFAIHLGLRTRPPQLTPHREKWWKPQKNHVNIIWHLPLNFALPSLKFLLLFASHPSDHRHVSISAADTTWTMSRSVLSFRTMSNLPLSCKTQEQLRIQLEYSDINLHE